jgi:hypothetical protein
MEVHVVSTGLQVHSELKNRMKNCDVQVHVITLKLTRAKPVSHFSDRVGFA